MSNTENAAATPAAETSLLAHLDSREQQLFTEYFLLASKPKGDSLVAGEAQRQQPQPQRVGPAGESSGSSSGSGSGNAKSSRSEGTARGTARRVSHKEVERRRRDVIRLGIERLAELLPCGDKRRGDVLLSAVAFIRRLELNCADAVRRMDVERLLAEQAIHELSSTVNHLAEENRQLQTQLALLRSPASYQILQPESNS